MRSFLVLFVAIFCVSFAIYGQRGPQNGGSSHDPDSGPNTGWYAGFEAGMSTTTDWLVGHFSDGVPTRCDGWLAGGNPNGAGCAGYNDVWSTEVETDPGLTIGGRVGYAWNIGDNWRLRTEGEYLRRQMQGDSQMSDTLDTKAGEFAFSWENVSDITIDQVGVNAIVDMPLTDKFMPFVGVGIAGVDPRFTYQSAWHRHSDAQEYYDLANAATPGRIPNLTLAESAGGTLSFGDFEMDDEFVLAGQAQFGANYQVADNSELGFKVRYTRFPWFATDPTTSGGHPWTPLRSHESSTGPGGDPIAHESTLGRLYNPDMSGEWLDDPDGSGLWDVSVQYTLFFGK